MAFAYWFGLVSALIILLICYVRRNDSILTSIPSSVLAFGPKRTTDQDVLATAERLANSPSLESREVLPPRTGRRYIVVGGGGFLGGWIVTKLLDRGEDMHNIRLIDIFPPTNHPILLDAIQKGLQFLKVDVTDAEALEAAFTAPWFESAKNNSADAEPELTVFHTAANIRFYERKLEFLDRSARVNVGGTENVIRASRTAGASVLVYTSSGSVGVWSTRLLLWPWEKEPEHFVQVINDDDSRLPKRHEDFFSNYAATKMKAEMLVRASDRANTGPSGSKKVIRTGCIRPGNGVFGPRGDMLCGAYLKRLTNPSWAKTIFSSFSYVENCAVAHLCYEARLIELQNGGRNPDIGGQAFCIADPGPIPTYGDAYTTLEVLSDGECTFPVLSASAMLAVAHIIEAYVRLQYALASSGWMLGKLLPVITGPIVNLQPSVFYLTAVHLIFDDSRARLPPEKGGLGYTGTWTTIEGLHKTAREHKETALREGPRGSGSEVDIGLTFFSRKKANKQKEAVKLNIDVPNVVPVEVTAPS
ncbi:3beta-hydroxysteroid-dehydrogenase/decarboxylase isoform 1 [Psilocybe cubensis]|uniref:3-beta hydroxysteroid dehydrogenase/isomerase domain-containing protein n=2 Tax=Psilocybe cubensis TaxID=181762 RepID=A0A8H7XNV3_PSICU|nr:3beta-hydroxysteroid-dehydrogenase/decarboxylase isoform 1 [Psilocybe cubensis]KAH9477846.1 3beta-hydroxysteroid-dehydrogenase/decarboxylase isoform 1 [Psilocybe cubensis]